MPRGCRCCTTYTCPPDTLRRTRRHPPTGQPPRCLPERFRGLQVATRGCSASRRRARFHSRRASASPVSIFTGTPRSWSVAMSWLASVSSADHTTSPIRPMRGSRFGAARHRQRPIALQCRSPTRASKRLDRRGLESARFGDGAHGAFHHGSRCPFCFDYGFRPPVFRIELRKETGRDLGKVVENVPLFCRGRGMPGQSDPGWSSCDASAAANKHIRLPSRAPAGSRRDGQFAFMVIACPFVHSAARHRFAGILRGAEAGHQYAALANSFDPTAMLTVNMTGRATAPRSSTARA